MSVRGFGVAGRFTGGRVAARRQGLQLDRLGVRGVVHRYIQRDGGVVGLRSIAPRSVATRRGFGGFSFRDCVEDIVGGFGVRRGRLADDTSVDGLAPGSQGFHDLEHALTGTTFFVAGNQEGD